MDASIVDLRYHMADVLKAIKRRETVKVFERNQLIGYLIPVESRKKMRVQDHPFFGSAKGDAKFAIKKMRQRRKSRIPRKMSEYPDDV